jgi:hypothetical protein
MKQIYLRPHHLICIMNFRGEGYSDLFVIEMGKIVDSIKRNRYQKIICLVPHCDDICKHCSKKCGERCEDEDQISKLDAISFKVLNLSYSDSFCWTEIQRAVETHLSLEEFEDTCCECQWFRICRNAFMSISSLQNNSVKGSFQ